VIAVNIYTGVMHVPARQESPDSWETVCGHRVSNDALVTSEEAGRLAARRCGTCETICRLRGIAADWPTTRREVIAADDGIVVTVSMPESKRPLREDEVRTFRQVALAILAKARGIRRND
jgi:hypothetical protein